MTVIAVILLYVSFGMVVSVVASAIASAAGDDVQTHDVVGFFVFWPIALAMLWADAMGASK